ncbi:MAG: glycosyltransferase 87 family protein [Planctomycetes bacterium]|nr:glycosyltransferase 87 family protein [Planctomycetota bacterium]
MAFLSGEDRHLAAVPSKGSAAWYTTKTFRRVVWVVAVLALVGSFANGVLRRDNDYRNHHLLGRAFLEGKPYLIPDQPPFYTNYPVGRLALNVVFGVFPYRWSRAIWWAVSLVVLWYSLRLWEQLAARRYSVSRETSFAAAAFALLIASRWLLRDLDDCGQQLLLLGILTAAGAAVLYRRPLLAGALLALGATYKVTPILFLPLLAYKRRWKDAAWMLVFVLGLNVLLPALWLGSPLAWQANQLFAAKCRQVGRDARTDPSANGVEDPKHTNKNLRLALARFVQTYPPGHALFIPHPADVRPDGTVPPEARPHPLFVQFLDLPAPTAGLVTAVLLLLLALVLAVCYRHPWTGPDFPQAFAGEWAAVVALCALLSPLCWGQHLVLFIPVLFATIRVDLPGAPRWRVVAMWSAAALILVGQRELLGRELWWVLESYKPQTLAALILLTLVLTIPKARVSPAPVADRPRDLVAPGTRADGPTAAYREDGTPGLARTP